MKCSSQLLFFLVSVVTCAVKGIREGDSCDLQATGQVGRCTHISRCAVILEEVYQGVAPQTCFIMGTVPVVCCPTGSSNITQSTQSGDADDKDECQTKKISCGDNQRCASSPDGEHTCHCNPGYHTTQSGDCVDIDECKDRGVCSQFGRCRNTLGSYVCRCNRGLTNSPSSNQSCVDIDECLPNGGLGNCQQKCINLWGSYLCECNSGFTLASDKITCEDIDECSEDKMNVRLCIGLCLNTLGSYQCSCPKGYRMGDDRRTCIDINECEESKHLCGEEQHCQNTRGGARCIPITCPTGFIRNSNKTNVCSRIICTKDDSACAQQVQTPLNYAFSFITLASRMHIPPGDQPQVNIYILKGPNRTELALSFKMSFLDAKAPLGVELATIDNFKLTTFTEHAVISLTKSITGPQDITLELFMDVYEKGILQGGAVAKIMIFVSEYEF